MMTLANLISIIPRPPDLRPCLHHISLLLPLEEGRVLYGTRRRQFYRGRRTISKAMAASDARPSQKVVGTFVVVVDPSPCVPWGFINMIVRSSRCLLGGCVFHGCFFSVLLLLLISEWRQCLILGCLYCGRSCLFDRVKNGNVEMRRVSLRIFV